MIINGGVITGGQYFDQPPPPPWVTSGLELFLDAQLGYSGSGTVWNDISGNSNNVYMVNPGSITYTAGSGAYFNLASGSFFYSGSANNLPTGSSPYTLDRKSTRLNSSH